MKLREVMLFHSCHLNHLTNWMKFISSLCPLNLLHELYDKLNTTLKFLKSVSLFKQYVPCIKYRSKTYVWSIFSLFSFLKDKSWLVRLPHCLYNLVSVFPLSTFDPDDWFHWNVIQTLCYWRSSQPLIS
jgi:hypothetical protein